MGGSRRRKAVEFAGQNVIPTRRQLSMYVPTAEGVQLEAARKLLDPVQAGLIPVHVTLCREDEIELLSASELGERLGSGAVRPVTLCFGPPVIFQEHGVLLPCVAGEQGFHDLRVHVLRSTSIRRHAPHITLAHPRNPPSSTRRHVDTIGIPDKLTYTFATIVSIEQVAAAPWRVMQEFALG